MNPFTDTPPALMPLSPYLPSPAASSGSNERDSAASAPAPGTLSRAKDAEDAKEDAAAPQSLGGLGDLGANPAGFGGQLAARVPAGALVASEDEDTTLGLQLTVEYERAVGGMRSVLTFGAMMMQLRERLLAQQVPTVGDSVQMNTNARSGQLLQGSMAHGQGMANWLAKHAPAIKRQTAQRLEEVAKGVALEYEKIVGAKVAKQIDLAKLVTTPTEDLAEPLRASQLDLFSFVDGTSQRSWLDKLRPTRERGGKTYERDGVKGARHVLTRAAMLANYREQILQTAKALSGIETGKLIVALEIDGELDGWIEQLETALATAKAWRALTKTERAEMIADSLGA